MRLAAFKTIRRRSECVAITVPLPGRAIPRASVRQFIELAVNIPEHDPQVGQAARSISKSSLSLTFSSAPSTMTSTRSRALLSRIPASIGPPDTKTAGILSLMAAISIPGVILSQLLMQIIASAQCAFTTYSTLSAISSLDGSE